MIHFFHGRHAALALWLGAACLPPFLQAQERIDRSFRMTDGLSNPQVSSIAEDRDGFLWIGTWDGINRFDGVHFTRFLDPNDIPLGRILAIHQAANGPLYLGGDHGAAFFDGERLRPLSPASGLAGATIEAISSLPDGTVFFGGSMGLVTRRSGGKWSSLLQAPVSDLCAAKDGTLYVGTGDRVLVLREGKISPWKDAGDLGELGSVWSLHEGRDGTLYVGTLGGLAVLRNGSLQVPPSARGHAIPSITTDGAGNLFLATFRSGVLRLHEASLEPLDPLTPENGVSDRLVHTVYAAQEGPVYFGTNDGLDRWSGDVLRTWTPSHGLPDKTIWSIVEDEKGDIYAASNAGVAVLQGKEWRSLRRSDGFPEGRTLYLHAGASGRLYAGDDQGQIWISEKGRLLRTLSLPKGKMVFGILEDPDGEVYVSADGEFALIRGSDVQYFPIPGDVYSFARAADGTLYLGTSQGLAAFRDGKVFRRWTRRDGLADDWIWTLRMGSDGSVFAGTRRGLSVLKNGHIETYDTSNGLANNFVVCILEGEAGRLYLSTHRGVNVLDLHPSDIPAQPRILPFSGFGQGTGNSEACLKDRQGRLWFGIQPLLALYDPALDRPRHPPRALLTGLQVFQDPEPLPEAGEEKLFSHNRNDLTFSFTGIDLAAHFMKFRYRLSGLDRDWIETDQRSVRYPNLLPGAYRFELQAGSESGLWSPPAGLAFTIHSPPWWRRPVLVLSLAAAALVLAGGLYAAARVRQRLALDRVRLSIAADLHDQVGAGLTDIAILSEVAARKAGELPELTRVAATARELVDSLGDIVWLVNPRRDSLYEIFLRLKDSYAELFAHAGAELEVGDLLPFASARLPMAFRQDLHLLFKEALHNALRHSGCRRAELTVTLQGPRLAVTLRDDGKGFHPESQDGKGDGLETMRRRAERLGGRLTLSSSPAGTVVSFAGAIPRR